MTKSLRAFILPLLMWPRRGMRWGHELSSRDGQDHSSCGISVFGKDPVGSSDLVGRTGVMPAAAAQLADRSGHELLFHVNEHWQDATKPFHHELRLWPHLLLQQLLP